MINKEQNKINMNNIFTICYSEEEANEIGHFIMRKGYEGVQNDSYVYEGPNDGGEWDIYEEALEAGLQEALKLI